jgi:hypothetical protein
MPVRSCDTSFSGVSDFTSQTVRRFSWSNQARSNGGSLGRGLSLTLSGILGGCVSRWLLAMTAGGGCCAGPGMSGKPWAAGGGVVLSAVTGR